MTDDVKKKLRHAPPPPPLRAETPVTRAVIKVAGVLLPFGDAPMPRRNRRKHTKGLKRKRR